MGYLEMLNKFYETLKYRKPRYLNRNDIVKEFLCFLKQDEKMDAVYYMNKYLENIEEYENFDDFIYSKILELACDLRKEYEKIEKLMKRRVNYYSNVVNELTKEIDSVSKNESDALLKSNREKLIFIRDINNVLLTMANNDKRNDIIFYKALNKCKKNIIPNNIFTFDNEFINYYNLEQYTGFDWKSSINFLHLSFSEQQEIIALKKNDYELYLDKFEYYINEFMIVQQLKEVITSNFYLVNRSDIILDSLDLFKKKRLSTFVYLVVPQIEGLLDVYNSILGKGSEKTLYGLSNKLQSIYDKKKMYGFIYYAFDFPILRNDIAHGNIIPISREVAFDLLMDLYYITSEIDSDRNNYKIMIAEYEKLSLLKNATKYNDYILSIFKSSLFNDENITWLKDCMEGEYIELLKWYGYTNEYNRLILHFKSERFLSSIFNDEPLELEKVMELDKKEYTVIELNKSIVEYVNLISIIKEFVDIPQKWLQSFYERISEIEAKEKEAEEKFNIYLETLKNR